MCEIRPGSLQLRSIRISPPSACGSAVPVTAVSVEVVEGAALPNARQIIKALAADYLWSDSTPQYFEDGYCVRRRCRGPAVMSTTIFGGSADGGRGTFLFPSDNGSEMVLDEQGQPYLMFPPNYPGLNGRPRIPAGSLESAWTRPGFYPNHMDWLRRHRQRVQAGGAMALAEIRLPWSGSGSGS